MIKNGYNNNFLIFNENGKDKIYGFGGNGCGKLGSYDYGKNTYDIVEFKYFSDKKIKDFQCGTSHNLILLGYINYFLFLLIFFIYFYFLYFRMWRSLFFWI
jgi:hypothetical protein